MNPLRGRVNAALAWALLPVLLAVSGCGAKSGQGADDGFSGDRAFEESADLNGGLAYQGAEFRRTGFDPAETDAPAGERSPSPVDGPSGSGAVPGKTRKLVKKADVSIEADKSLLDRDGKLTGVNQKMDELLKRHGAYAEYSLSDEDSARYTIRVPQASYGSMLSAVGVLGKVRSRSETAEDVTLKYYDLEGRLNTRKTLLGTFQGYLGRAQSIDDIMKIETRIADLQNDIDWLGTQLQELASLADYATIELSVYSPGVSSDYGLPEKIRDLFAAFRGFASGGLLVILGIIIFGLPLVIIFLLAYWLFFGRVGLLKKAFRLAVRGRDTDIKKE
ncbi:MAG: DUF4349 domain-containing protein [Spirochaetaceae bacterium]|jgi:hypothetical protein|nr:DUF4349 domain-containing protein [Spirochaetaceae bacterium]